MIGQPFRNYSPVFAVCFRSAIRASVMVFAAQSDDATIAGLVKAVLGILVGRDGICVLEPVPALGILRNYGGIQVVAALPYSSQYAELHSAKGLPTNGALQDRTCDISRVRRTLYR